MKTLTCTVIVVLLAMISLPFAYAADGSGVVTGVVVDAEKKGVEETDVSIYNSNDLKAAVATSTTSTDGKFILNNVPPGKDYIVKAVKRKSMLGVRAEQQHVTVEASKTTDVGILELKVPKR